MTNKNRPRWSNTKDGKKGGIKCIEMRYEDENIWLTQKMMATLYDVSLTTINEHIKTIYDDSELEKPATVRKFRIVQTEGSRQVRRETNQCWMLELEEAAKGNGTKSP